MRIPKSDKEMVSDCRSHLLFLQEALDKYNQGETNRYKQIAAELRVLVVNKGQNKPLLLDLMDKYGFAYDILPMEEGPFKDRPIELVEWNDQELLIRDKLDEALRNENYDEANKLQNSLRKKLSLREYTDKALAMLSGEKQFTYRNLISSISEQMGSSHEDAGIEPSLDISRKFLIGGHEGHFVSLVGYTSLILNAGTNFMEFLHKKDSSL